MQQSYGKVSHSSFQAATSWFKNEESKTTVRVVDT